MTSIELAEKIYNHINSLNTFGERWDKWDDKREIEFIRSLIDNHHQPKETLYTGEQIMEALSYGYHAAKDELKGIPSTGYGTRFIQSLKQPKKD